MATIAMGPALLRRIARHSLSRGAALRPAWANDVSAANCANNMRISRSCSTDSRLRMAAKKSAATLPKSARPPCGWCTNGVCDVFAMACSKRHIEFARDRPRAFATAINQRAEEPNAEVEPGGGGHCLTRSLWILTCCFEQMLCLQCQSRQSVASLQVESAGPSSPAASCGDAAGRRLRNRQLQRVLHLGVERFAGLPASPPILAQDHVVQARPKLPYVLQPARDSQPSLVHLAASSTVAVVYRRSGSRSTTPVPSLQWGAISSDVRRVAWAKCFAVLL